MKIWQKQLSDDRMLWREKYRNDPSFWLGRSQCGIVSTAHYRATAVGVDILSKGGNAIDAAIATSLALGVVEPAGSGLGGMTMMMIYLSSSKRTFALDGSCKAPLSATPEEVTRFPRKRGYRAIAVPSNPAVLDFALRHYGTCTIEDLLEPVIKIAEEGYPITLQQYNLTKRYRKSLSEGTAAKFMLGSDNEPLPPGTLFRQPVLARTLRIIQKAGFKDFYTGEIGCQIVADMIGHNGFIRKTDLANIPWPVEREPITCQFGDWTISTLPPPGGGTTLIQMLQLFDELVPSNFDPDSPEAAILFAQIIKQVRFDRRKYRLGKFSGKAGNLPDLTSSKYAKKVAVELRSKSDGIGETSHLSIIDRVGNTVAMTQSLERCFGAKIATEALGFLYNGYMKTFKIKNKRHPFYLRPGAAARSNAAPTIIFKQGVPIYALGSTGSERMVSGIFQVIVRLKYQAPFQAVQAPLEKHGFKIHRLKSWSFKVGGLQLAAFDGRLFVGVADPRRDGAVAGPDRIQGVS